MKALILGLAILLVGCGGGDSIAFIPTVPAQPAPAASVEACTVDLYGDSIMAGNGTPETPAVVLHALRPGLKVVDHAVAGTSLAMLANTFATSPRTGRFVVIENGVIDSWTSTPPEDFRDALRGMLLHVRAEGRVPVLTGYSFQVPGTLTPMSVLRRDQFNAVAKALAGELGVPFADWGAARFDGADDLMDTVHPARAYSDRLVERLALALDTVMECK
ncbi:SGNH/GDSL hydrolase family protein [Variovorax sp. dw_954]|uniref:SGNH/GDSL hydrolase family protein n=1 Tax=Variovorax sp. dw_954 TaxID=2720078 RepID=UPI001BD37B79|nr:SGNH/GDSL hydrolase family protein [Variovorax sp. dw_954]